MPPVLNGIDILAQSEKHQKLVCGNIGYLCHNASVTADLRHGIFTLQKIFGLRLKKIFGPQHGFATDVQDNMVESQDFVHPFFGLPVYSLYSETRIPTGKMLEGLNTVIVDLQDVGTRVYTYISTLFLLMRVCGEKGIRVIILDRVNPAGGEITEGAVLQKEFLSFVGMLAIPQRHGLTVGEISDFAKKYCGIKCETNIVPVKNWKRTMLFSETGLPWIMPSPNLPVAEGCLVYPGSVLFEGTAISEGRGTTRSLELIGHPDLEPYSFCDQMNRELVKQKIGGIFLRPTHFIPTFNKHREKLCGGFQIHLTNPREARVWLACQWICRFLFKQLNLKNFWNTAPYEYEFKTLAIDLINGTDQIRFFIEKGEDFYRLQEIEQTGLDKYLKQREEILQPNYE